MPLFDDLLTGFMPGNDLSATRPIDGIPDGDSLAEAWLAVKADPKRDTDAEALIFKHITPTNVPGVGQITDTGAGDEEAAVRFDFSASETLLIKPDVTYHFEIKCLTNGGKRYTSHVGTVRAPARQVVRA